MDKYIVVDRVCTLDRRVLFYGIIKVFGKACLIKVNVKIDAILEIAIAQTSSI